MRNDYPEYFYGFPFITWGTGLMIPFIIFQSIDSGKLNLENSVFRLSYFSFIVLIISLCYTFGPKFTKINQLGSNSLTFMCVVTFVIGLVSSVLSCLYTLIPLPDILLNIVSILILLGAVVSQVCEITVLRNNSQQTDAFPGYIRTIITHDPLNVSITTNFRRICFLARARWKSSICNKLRTVLAHTVISSSSFHRRVSD